MKPVGNLIRDVPIKGLEPPHTEADLLASLEPEAAARAAQERLVGENRAKGGKAEKVDYAAIARASILAGREWDREARVARRIKDDLFRARWGKGEAAAAVLRLALPAKDRGYVTAAAPKTAGNREARGLIAQLVPGRSLHLYGRPGTTKTHLAVRAARLLAKLHGLRVRYLDAAALQGLAYDHNHPDDFLAAGVILVDDLDKVEPGAFASPTVVRLLSRPEQGLTLITTAQRPLEQLATRYAPDAANREALLSRLFYVREALVTGPDFRPYDAARHWRR